MKLNILTTSMLLASPLMAKADVLHCLTERKSAFTIKENVPEKGLATLKFKDGESIVKFTETVGHSPTKVGSFKTVTKTYFDFYYEIEVKGKIHVFASEEDLNPGSYKGFHVGEMQSPKSVTCQVVEQGI